MPVCTFKTCKVKAWKLQSQIQFGYKMSFMPSWNAYVDPVSKQRAATHEMDGNGPMHLKISL